MAARDWRVIRAFAGRLKKCANPMVRLVSFRAMKQPAHLALHPFGQIPTYEEGDLALFETALQAGFRRSIGGLHRQATDRLIAGKRMRTRAIFKQQLDQPQFQTGPIGVRVQQGPKLPPL
jgi:hypothetical protein